MIPHNNRFNYDNIKRLDSKYGRSYIVDGNRIPSVTTILSKTKDMTSIQNWKNNIGHDNANAIIKASSLVGTVMHEKLENYLWGIDKPIGTNPYRIQGGQLADIIKEKGLDNSMEEFWGTEVSLHYETLYAGTTDLVGIYEGEEAIIDFKNSRKPKKEEYILDYKQQLVSYGKAHNNMFGTNIRKGVILMVSREGEHFGSFQKFVLEGEEWDKISNTWCETLESYYKLNI